MEQFPDSVVKSVVGSTWFTSLVLASRIYTNERSSLSSHRSPSVSLVTRHQKRLGTRAFPWASDIYSRRVEMGGSG